ncbi:MAG: PilZ domain-containing protein [Sphingomonas sp.]|uniref:PilZ domain-containing protein n=1 Tax=Sphingomonas sp. TaxID=28214 RepID=UPI001ACC8EEE|nr:PilZ domain-containing protein [Sphingomonas sp.]MBN8807239.1 PilZ domain-containing protein [Sphingomonas sp.]
MSDDSAPERSKRDSIFRMARIVVPETGATITSRIRNVSDTGACIDAVEGIAVGQTIEVTIGKDAPVIARIAWTSERQFGIAFDRDDPLDHVVQFQSGGLIAKAGWMAGMRDRYRP